MTLSLLAQFVLEGRSMLHINNHHIYNALFPPQGELLPTLPYLEAFELSAGMVFKRPSASCLVWLAMMAPSCYGDVGRISIRLLPRNYTSPRDRPGFTCGVQELDSSRHLAELSSAYILKQLNNTGDPDVMYRTKVLDMAFLTTTGAFHMMDSPCTANCTGLYSLVLVPPTGSCYEGIFADAETLSKDHIVVYVGASLPVNVITKFESEAEKLKRGLFYGEMPRMCSTQTYMEPVIAESRVQTFTALFNFPFLHPERQLADMERSCITAEENEQSLAFSGVFDYNPATQNFKIKNDTVLEETGFCETNISRADSGKVGLAFVKTTLGTSNLSDLVPYDGPVVFSLAATTASFFIPIKVDNVEEEDETFSVMLKTVSRRSKRAPTGQGEHARTGETEVQQKHLKISNDKTRKAETPRFERAIVWGRAVRSTLSILDGSALEDYADYVVWKWTDSTRPFRIPDGRDIKSMCADYDNNLLHVFSSVFKLQKYTELSAEWSKLQWESIQKAKGRNFEENKKKFEEEGKDFEAKFFPCLLQDILINREKELPGWKDSRDMEDLYRLTTKEHMKRNFGITINDWRRWEKKRIESKSFLSFAMKEEKSVNTVTSITGESVEEITGEKTYLLSNHYLGRDVGLEVLKEDRRRRSTEADNKRCGARSIQHLNKHPNGEREALYPIGTCFEIVRYTQVEHPVIGFPDHILSLVEVSCESPK